MKSIKHLADIVKAFARIGLVLDAPVFNGQSQRCATETHPGKRNGGYKAYLDADGNPAYIMFHNFETGDSGAWKPPFDETALPEEKAAAAKALKEAQAIAEKKLEELRRKAAIRASGIYERGFKSEGNEYLASKGVPSVPRLKASSQGVLVMPLQNAKGDLTTIQHIYANGDKRLLRFGKKAGSFFPIKGEGDTILIVEGLATGISVHTATGYATLVAVDAGNLLSIAQIARERHPEKRIILCADNDITPGKLNTGVDKATEAALHVDGYIAVPQISEAGKLVKCDFNDLHQAAGKRAVKRQIASAVKPIGYQTLNDGLPYGYSLTRFGKKAGLYCTEKKKDTLHTFRVGTPLYVLGMTRDETSKSWGKLLEWEDPDGNRHRWAMPIALLAGMDQSAWLGRLLDEGWSLNDSKSATTAALSRFLSQYATSRRALCVHCTGWHQGVYVLPDAVIGEPETGETIALQVQTAHNPFMVRGTLKEWKNSIGQWSRGNSRMTLAVCCSLASALIGPAGQESGGFNVIGRSSTGKTTILVAAASCWGKDTSSGGFAQSWRATTNGLEGLAALLSDSLLCLDEIGQAPPKTVIEASYMLANGMGKTRAAQDGRARAAKSWRCMILSTGEKGLADRILEEGGTVQAGQSVRLVDIPGDAEQGYGLFEDIHGHASSKAFSDAVKTAAAENYGHIAREFISLVIENMEAVREALAQPLPSKMLRLCGEDADGQVKRVASRFHLCAIAGELAAEWALLPWEEGEALNACVKCFKAWLDYRGGTGAAEDTAILEKVMLFLENHGSSRFQDVYDEADKCHNRVGFKASSNGSVKYMIFPESFRNEVCKGHNPKRAATILDENGLLVRDGKNYLAKPGRELPGWGRKRCYIVKVKEAK